MEIPFHTLNFDPDATEWGANFQRTVRRKTEEDFWSGWARNQGLLNLTSARRIVGISDVSQGHGLDIKPYVLTPTSSRPGPGAARCTGAVKVSTCPTTSRLNYGRT